jgi:hypothetical protein
MGLHAMGRRPGSSFLPAVTRASCQLTLAKHKTDRSPNQGSCERVTECVWEYKADLASTSIN